MNDAAEFNGRRVLISGGAKGLGRAAAERLADIGARVAILDRDEDAVADAARALGAEHVARCGDVTSEHDVTDIATHVLDRLGPIDVAINCAGVPDSFTPTLEQRSEDFRRVIDVHLTGTWLVSQTVARQMLPRKSGAIINLSSMAGVLGLTPRNAYSAAKAGIATMTRTIACEWAASGVRVNAIAPGYVITPFFARLMEEGKLDGKAIRRRTPMGAFGAPKNVVDAMLFLASSRAAFITGVTLPVDGGYSAWGATGDAYNGPLD